MSGVLLVAGALLTLVAATGVVRFPDVYSRMSAASKAGTLGAALLLAGAAWHFGETAVSGRALVTLLFVYLTAPVAAHRIGRAAWRSGVRPWGGTLVDELGPPPSSPTSIEKTDGTERMDRSLGNPGDAGPVPDRVAPEEDSA